MKRLWLGIVFTAGAIGLFAMYGVAAPISETMLNGGPRCDPTHPDYPKYESYRLYGSEVCGWFSASNWMWRLNYAERGAVIGLGLVATSVAVGCSPPQSWIS